MKRILWLGLLMIGLVSGPFLLGAGEVPREAPDALRVYYAGQVGAVAADDPVRRALTLTDQLVLVERLDQAQVTVVFNAWPAGDVIRAVRDRGMGLVLFMGPQLDTRLAALAPLGLGWGGGWFSTGTWVLGRLRLSLGVRGSTCSRSRGGSLRY